MGVVGLQAALHLLYPPQCITCDSLVTTDFGLCGSCWKETPFISGLVCNRCGAPLPGQDGDETVLCDECLYTPRPWDRGRAVMTYSGNARELVLSLKHADRLDLAKPAGRWLLNSARPLIHSGILVAPIPLHWQRMFWRKYNQSALLSWELCKLSGLDHCPDLLRRIRNTHSQEGRDREGRFSNVADAFGILERHRAKAEGRHILLVDDVMTSGATFAAATEACLSAGAAKVSVLALCRVAKNG